MKIALIVFMSSSIAKNPERLKKFWTGLVPYLLLVGVIAAILLLEPHMSATVIMVVIAGAILLVGRCKNDAYSTIFPVGSCGRICTF